jgi:hypothetical protein
VKIAPTITPAVLPPRTTVFADFRVKFLLVVDFFTATTLVVSACAGIFHDHSKRVFVTLIYLVLITYPRLFQGPVKRPKQV